MTNDEAIEIIKKDGWGYPENMHTEAVMMAIDALEKQAKQSEAEEYRTPKKVLYTFTNANSEKRIYGCPACEHFIPHKGRKYCLNCGQALDWSEVK